MWFGQYTGMIKDLASESKSREMQNYAHRKIPDLSYSMEILTSPCRFLYGVEWS